MTVETTPKTDDPIEKSGIQLSLFGSDASMDGMGSEKNQGASLQSGRIARILGERNESESSSFLCSTQDRPWSVRELEAWAPPDSQLVSDWAIRHRVLSPRFSAAPGPWMQRGYYAVEIMDAFLDPMVEDITLMAAAQSMKTDSVYNMLGYAIDQDPSPALVVMPTLQTLSRVNERIRDMIEESPCLSGHMTQNDDDFSIKKIKLDNMHIYFATAGSSPDLRNVIARYVIMDELDDYAETAGKGSQGSPIGQAEARATTYWNRKRIKLSTPTTESGFINLEYQKSDRRKYWVPCPQCLGYQVLSFWRIKHAGCKLGEWPKDKRGKDYILTHSVARYECEHCGFEIGEQHKSWMDRMGTWIPEGHPIDRDGSTAIPMPRSRHRGYQWSALISPWVTWHEMAAGFFEAKDDPEDLKVFVNLKLGEIWQEATIKREVEEILSLRTDRPALVAPPGTVALTAGVDNQKHGKWVVIRAWVRDGRSMESHLIRSGFVDSFDELNHWLFDDVYQVEDSEVILPIWRGGIDIGGGDKDAFDDETMTEEVYEWLRIRGRRVMFGVKGVSRPLGGGRKMRSSIIDRMPSRRGKTGRPIPGGIKLWLVDSALLKEAIWSRIGAGKFHINADVDSTYAKHMTAEAKEKTAHGRTVWTVKGRRANHLFDAEVYASAMADPECDGGVWVLRPVSGPTTPTDLEPRKLGGVAKSNWMTR